MLAALILPLEVEANAARPNETCPNAHEAHGWFFHQLAETNPALASHLHDTALSPKPFTIAVIGGQNRLALRVTLIPHRDLPELYSSLLPMLHACVGHEIRLGAHTYRVKAVLHESHHLAGLETQTGLLHATKADESLVTLEFLTPTTFRRGQLLMPLPEPRRVFHGLVQKWNAGSNVPVDDAFLPWVEETVTVYHSQGRTRLIDLGFIKTGSLESIKYAGFTGRVTFQATDRNAVRVKQLGALARFALFAGVGYKTTQGLGVTRFVTPKILELEVNPAWAV
jgi:CRISPR-associated endoribonuclease Cas6